MSLVCGHCGRTLEFSGEPPLFCGYCGQRLPPRQGPTEQATEQLAAPTITRAAGEQEAGGGQAFPDVVGGYRLLRPLGKGGMGTVFEAEDSSGRHVAVKLIAPEYTASKETVERFRQEGKLASGISHPRCVFVLAADEEAGQPYIVMELMPGRTLRDLVSEQGPLPPARAVGLILDVIEGLEEAHRKGVIHRDVKPSNCFLQADGRVKVGDFGLSRSLSSDAHLTRTGTFLGTPLFASPEQVRAEPLDLRTDIYSVAATLYYLLAGRAPFEGGDAASVLARLVSEPPPPLRPLRPEVSPGLERVVLRGLERQRERRWQSLEEFRAALLPFVPGKLSFGGMGSRFGAYLVDTLVLTLLDWMVILAGLLIGLIRTEQLKQGSWESGFWLEMLGQVVLLGYFTLLEGKWGCSAGKWLLRLRVCGSDGSEPPGLARAALRTVLFIVFLSGPGILLHLLVGPERMVRNPALILLGPLASLAGILLVLSTMRARSGFRGPYEWLSGTRVIGLPTQAVRKHFPAGDPADGPVQAAGLPGQVGPYVVLGLLQRSEEEQVLLAEEGSLHRRVWLWLRPASRAALPETRQRLGRTARLRWLGCGQEGDLQWDAFLAPAGCRLRTAVAGLGRFSWPEARPVLEELAEELAVAGEEGTLPARLELDQVWAQPDGHVLLLDFSVAPGRQAAEPAGQQGAVELLGRTAALLLEGRPRGEGPLAPGPVRAPVPLYVSRFLPRLLGGPEPYRQVQEFQADLAATSGRPAEVRRMRRVVHLLLVAAFVFSPAWPLLFVPLLASPRVQYVVRLGEQGRETDQVVQRLEQDAGLSLAVNLVDPSPLVRLQGVALWEHDRALRERLKEKQSELNREHEAWREAMPQPQRLWADFTNLFPTRLPKAGESRAAGQRTLATDVRGEIEAGGSGVVMLVMLGFWMAPWVVWAFLTRGGLGYWLAGIRLVRGDGRPAARWQCAARSLLFWAPLFALLAGSFGLDYWSWSVGDPRAGGLIGWLPWLSFMVWVVGLFLLPVYAVLALRSPGRSLHDRLVGTYLVPR